MSDQDEYSENQREIDPKWAEWKARGDYPTIFQSLQPDWQISIDRTRPTWCEGWCETVYHDPDDPIDLEYLREAWGGHRFKLTVRDQHGQYITKIHVRIDGEPKRFGKRVPHPDEIEHTRSLERSRLELATIQNQPVHTTAPAIDPTIGQLLTKSLDNLGSSKDAQFDFAVKMFERINKREPEGRRDVKELVELATSMKELSGIFGGGDSGGDDLFTANAGRFLDILDRKSKQDERKKQAPQKQIRIVKNLGHAGTTANPDASPPPDLSATLARMSPVDACAVFTGALMKMSPQERAEVSEILMGEYDGDDDDDDESDESTDDGTSEKVS